MVEEGSRLPQAVLPPVRIHRGMHVCEHTQWINSIKKIKPKGYWLHLKDDEDRNHRLSLV